MRVCECVCADADSDGQRAEKGMTRERESEDSEDSEDSEREETSTPLGACVSLADVVKASKGYAFENLRSQHIRCFYGIAVLRACPTSLG